MKFRLAVPDDLPYLQEMFKEIIVKMRQNHIDIWDDIYPTDFFEEDIDQKRLYILEENQVIVSAFALMTSDAGKNQVQWLDNDATALYLTRFGVNVRYQKCGIGSLMLQKAISVAKERQISCLRLFVAIVNQSAIQLYQKNGFIRAKGIYREVIDDQLTLQEYGFEIQTNL